MAVLCLGLAAQAHAQITTSAIEGLVKDSSGGVLPGVNVQVTNTDTNISRSVATDASGRFQALEAARAGRRASSHLKTALGATAPA